MGCWSPPPPTACALCLAGGDEQAACLLSLSSKTNVLRFTFIVAFSQFLQSYRAISNSISPPKQLHLLNPVTPPYYINMADQEGQIVEFAGLSGASPEEVCLNKVCTESSQLIPSRPDNILRLTTGISPKPVTPGSATPKMMAATHLQLPLLFPTTTPALEPSMVDLPQRLHVVAAKRLARAPHHSRERRELLL